MVIEKILNKIMVIEDEIDIITIIKFSLERLGQFKVEYSSTGKNVEQQIEIFMPDLILTDMMLPEISGLSILAAIRQNPQFNQIPVIFMTAKAQPEEIKNYLKAGAIAVIAKPFDPLTLPDKLRAIWSENEKNSGGSNE